VQSAINCIVFILKSAISTSVTVEDLVQTLRSGTSGGFLSNKAIKVLAFIWTEHRPRFVKQPQFNVGKLVRFEWKLCVAVESSDCRTIDTPYIQVIYHVAHPNVDKPLTKHTVLMNMGEFHSFATQMKALANVFATI